MESLPCKDFEYLLSCDINLDVAIKVRTLDLGQSLSESKSGGDVSDKGNNSSEELNQGEEEEEELYITAQLFVNEYAMHVVPMTTCSCRLGADFRRAAWGEWVFLPVRYTHLELNSCVFLSVWSARRGLVGYSFARLFDQLGRLKRGRVQIEVNRSEEISSAWEAFRQRNVSIDVPRTSNESTAAVSAREAAQAERNRIWLVGEQYNHEEVTRLEWLDILARQRARDITDEAIAIDGEREVRPVLTIEFPYFEYPVLFEERTYYSETMDAIFSMRSLEENQARQRLSGKASEDVRGGTSSGSSPPNSPRSRLAATEEFPWETQLSVVHDPELMHSKGRTMDGKESLNPVEEKYRKLNPGTVRGAVDRFLMPNKDERQRILQVIHHQSGRLNRKNQDLLWKFSHSLTSDRKALIKFVMSVDWDNPNEYRQAEELLGVWAPIDIADALRLLGDEPEFRTAAVRAHAIKVLDQASDAELLLYLLQLVQALRYDNVPIIRVDSGAPSSSLNSSAPAKPSREQLHQQEQQQLRQQDSKTGSKLDTDWEPGLLARFLIRRAINSESLVSFFMWYLSTEVEHQESGALYEKVRAELLKQLRRSPRGRGLAAALAEQTLFVKKVVGMGKEGRGRAVTRQNYLQRMLKQPEGKYHELCNLRVPIMHPLWPWKRITAVEPDSLRVFNSKTQPIKLDMILDTSSDTGGDKKVEQQKSPAFFKVGDDLRQDQLVLQLLGVMDKMFKDVNLDLNLTLYRVLSFSNDEGVMEFVSGSMSLTQIQKRFGSIGAFFRKQAHESFKAQEQRSASSSAAAPAQTVAAGARTNVNTNVDDVGFGSNMSSGIASPNANATTSLPTSDRSRSEKEFYDELVTRFIKSCAGYCMCTYVLCVGDRHLDNIMIRENGALFHIDFGYIFGHDPRSWAVGPIRLTRDMIETMGGRGSPGFEKFISYCCQAYRVLRSNSNLILNLLHLMKDSKIENLFDDHKAVIEIVRERFELDRSDENAEVWLLDKLRLCEDSFLTQVSDTAHNISLYFN